MPPPPGFTLRTEDRNRDTHTRNETEEPSRAPAGYTRRQENAHRGQIPSGAPGSSSRSRPRKKTPSKSSGPTPSGATPSSSGKPSRPRPRQRPKDRPLDVGATSLGVITVVMARPMALLIEGGETMGQHWIPRSQILDGEDLDRHAEEGQTGELWVPSWLADKIPW